MTRYGQADETSPVSRRRAMTIGAAGIASICLGCSGTSRDERSSPSSTTSPPADGGFGTRVDAGGLRDVLASIARDRLLYVPTARTYLVAAPTTDPQRVKDAYPRSVRRGLDAGLLALYQKCTHLGCRIPYCATSQMFECPCHNGIFTATGEWRAGPQPRGMDLFAIDIRNQRVLIDTATVVPGLAQNVDVSGQQPAGPHCI